MIPYVNSSFGIQILTRVHGSALYKSFLPALISTTIYIAIVLVSDKFEMDELFLHPYPMQALVTAFTFLLVFRANYSYNRWWEAYTAVYLMHSKWLDLATEIAAFHYQSKRYDKFKPPSFGSNPGVQSLDAGGGSFLGNNSSSLDTSSRFGLSPNSSLDVEGNAIVFTRSPDSREDAVLTQTPSPAKRSLESTPSGRIRHAKQPTLNDLIEQMDACEEEAAKMKQQSLITVESKQHNDDDDEEDDVQDCCAEIDQIYAGSENDFYRTDFERGEGGEQASGKEGRSWFRKIRDKRTIAKMQRKTKELEKLGRKADALSIHVGTIATIGGNSLSVNSGEKGKQRKHRGAQKKSRRLSRHAATERQPATARLFKQRKSIGRTKDSAIRQEPKLESYDRVDVKTGKMYSMFTAVSRKNLRDGNLDPDVIPPMLFLEECAHLLSLMSAVAFSTLRNDLPEAESPLTVFEPGLPWPLVDPDEYKAKVRKGWTQSQSRLYSVIQFALGRSRNDHARTLYNAARPFRVIGSVSDAEIEKIMEARGPLAKVSLISMWLLELITREHQAGSMGDVAAPIISRLYQFVSEGLAGYNQARKIAYIPFPFPHAQITTLFLLIVDFFVTPLLMTTFVSDPILGFFLNLFSVLCFTGLHEVARELENPFQNVPNDVPLNNYQAQFNEGLMVMFYGYHPDFYWNKEEKNNSEFTTPSNQNDDGSLKASATAKTVDNPHTPFQAQKPSHKKISAICDNIQLLADATSRGSVSKTTFDNSFRISQKDSLSIDRPSLDLSHDESINLSFWKLNQEGVEPNMSNNGGDASRISDANSIITSHPASSIQTDEFFSQHDGQHTRFTNYDGLISNFGIRK